MLPDEAVRAACAVVMSQRLREGPACKAPSWMVTADGWDGYPCPRIDLFVAVALRPASLARTIQNSIPLRARWTRPSAA